MYCNNCNVKLSNHMSKCPLCHKKITDSIDDEYNDVYGEEIEYLPKEINVLYFSKLIIVILILSTITTVICNLAINKTISWSLYVIFSSLFVCSHYFLLISSNKKICIIINTINLELLLFVSAYLNNGLNWYLCLVGPLILLAIGLILFINRLSKLKNILRNIAYFLIYVLLSLLVINGLIKLYKTGTFYLSWSYYSNIPLLIISIILIILSFNKKLMIEVEKRLFI